MHLVIIGNGITGVSAACSARHLDLAARITLVSAESAHLYSRTALRCLHMGHLRYQDTKPYGDWFWAENRLELVHAEATGLDPAARQVQLSTGQRLAYDQLLLATGSRYFNWPSQQLRGVQGLHGLPPRRAQPQKWPPRRPLPRLLPYSRRIAADIEIGPGS